MVEQCEEREMRKVYRLIYKFRRKRLETLKMSEKLSKKKCKT